MKSLQTRLLAGPFALAMLGIATWSCSSDDTPAARGNSGTGGSPSTGGVPASGGSTSTGGVSASGGSTPTGGVSTSGGSTTAGNGGSSGSTAGGGSSGSSAGGGSAGTLAGGSTNGGSSAAGAAQAGMAGGGTASGGASLGGAMNGGSSAGGTAGTAAGGAAGGSQGKGSPGCGSASPLKSGNFTENIDGTNRKWMLDVPSNYDGNKPYRLIFVWHPLNGSGSQVVSEGYNGLKQLANNTAIFATADGLNGGNAEASGTGWWNVNGGDMKLVQAMLDKINGGLCVDQDRIFSTGFSFGGMMSYTLPFEFNVFRAVAPCSGKTGVIPFTEKYTNPVPIMAFHGDMDKFVATNLGKAFFDKYAARNKCGTQTEKVSPNGCVQYQGCEVPSTWCIFPGGHMPWSEEPAAIWKFFSQF